MRIALVICTIVMATTCSDPVSAPGAGSALAIAWRVTPSTGTTGNWPGTPAVEGGRLFVQVGHDVAAFDAATGRELWTRRVRIAPFPPPTTLLTGAGRLYLSETDSVLAMDQSTGRTLWAFHPDSQAVVTPALDADALYTGQRGLPVVYSLRAADGVLRWRTTIGAGYEFPAYVEGLAVSGDTVFVAGHRNLVQNGYISSGVLVALDRQDGHELWRYETTPGVTGSPSSRSLFRGAPRLAGNIVSVLDYGAGTVVGVDRTSHRVVWQGDLGSRDAPIVAALRDNVVYVGGSSGGVFALDAVTGARRWQRDVGGSVLGIGICGGGVLVNEDHVKRLNTSTGAITSSLDPVAGIYDAPFSSSLASDGVRAYIVGSDGVYALKC